MNTGGERFLRSTFSVGIFFIPWQDRHITPTASLLVSHIVFAG